VSDEQDGNETVVDVRTNQRIGAVSVGGEAGNTQYDPVSHHIYVAVQTKNQVVVIDPTEDLVIERHDTPGCDHPHGLLLDADQHRAFVACQGNNKLLVMDMPSMQVTSTQEVGQDPDVLALDPSLHQLYVAAESGPLTAFVQNQAGVHQLAQGDVGPNAHSVSVNPETHHLYLPLQNVGGQPVLREVALDAPSGG